MPVENTVIMLLLSTQSVYSPYHVKEILLHDLDHNISNIEVVCFLASLEERVNIQFIKKKKTNHRNRPMATLNVIYFSLMHEYSGEACYEYSLLGCITFYSSVF